MDGDFEIATDLIGLLKVEATELFELLEELDVRIAIFFLKKRKRTWHHLAVVEAMDDVDLFETLGC